jgi:hypothetical protein
MTLSLPEMNSSVVQVVLVKTSSVELLVTSVVHRVALSSNSQTTLLGGASTLLVLKSAPHQGPSVLEPSLVVVLHDFGVISHRSGLSVVRH